MDSSSFLEKIILLESYNLLDFCPFCFLIFPNCDPGMAIKKTISKNQRKPQKGTAFMQDKDFIPDPSRKATDEQKPMIPIKKVLDLLEAHLGATSEIVYHDLTRPYDCTYVHHALRCGNASDICRPELGG